MNNNWIEDYLMTKKGVTQDSKKEWQLHRFQILKKKFAAIYIDNEGSEIIILKCESSLGSPLRNQYASVRPYHYVNKNHWDSVDLNGEVPDERLKEMINQSYQLLL